MCVCRQCRVCNYMGRAVKHFLPIDYWHPQSSVFSEIKKRTAQYVKYITHAVSAKKPA